MDIDNLYNECMKGRLGKRYFSGTRIKNHVISPFITYCDANVDPELKDSEGPLLRLLSQKGKSHEEEMVNTFYPNGTISQISDPKEAFLQFLKLATIKTRSFYGFPLYYVPKKLMGYPDVITLNEEHSSIFGEYYYEIIEIKIKLKPELEHKLQAAYYTYLIGQIQHYTPENFYLIDGNGTKTSYKYAEFEDQLFKTLDEINEIWSGKIVPPAIYNETSEDYSWSEYRNQLAIENKDISLIPKVKTKLRTPLIESGYDTIEKISQANISDLQNIKGINRTAELIIKSAEAINKNEIIKIKKFNGKQEINSDVSIYIDLEEIAKFYAPDRLDKYVFMFGLLLESEKDVKFYPNFVTNPYELKEREKTIKEFVNIIEKYSKAPIFHWGNYEVANLPHEMELFDLTENYNCFKDRLIDLSKIISDNFAFPVYSYSIKEIAKYLGFKWHEEDMDGMNAIVKYLDFLKNQSIDKNLYNSLVQYNEDDLLAIKVIKNWLRKNILE